MITLKETLILTLLTVVAVSVGPVVLTFVFDIKPWA